MIGVVQCGNCKGLLRSWEIVERTEFVGGKTELYRCTNRTGETKEQCDYYTTVKIFTTKARPVKTTYQGNQK
jgi:hypothetical protein